MLDNWLWAYICLCSFRKTEYDKCINTEHKFHQWTYPMESTLEYPVEMCRKLWFSQFALSLTLSCYLRVGLTSLLVESPRWKNIHHFYTAFLVVPTLHIRWCPMLRMFPSYGFMRNIGSDHTHSWYTSVRVQVFRI